MNYHKLSTSLRSLFWFSGPHPNCSGSLSPLLSVSFPNTAGGCFLWKSSESPAHTTCWTLNSRQTKHSILVCLLAWLYCDWTDYCVVIKSAARNGCKTLVLSKLPLCVKLLFDCSIFQINLIMKLLLKNETFQVSTDLCFFQPFFQCQISGGREREAFLSFSVLPLEGAKVTKLQIPHIGALI